MMTFRIRSFMAAGLAGVAWLAFAAGAQAGDPYHIRGKLAAIDGQTLTVDTVKVPSGLTTEWITALPSGHVSFLDSSLLPFSSRPPGFRR